MATKTGNSDRDTGLDVGDANKLDVTNETQAPVDDNAHFVRPKVTMEPMTTNVTIPVSKIERHPGFMTVITTTAGQLIVPQVGFASGEMPEPTGDEPVDTTVVVNAAYARSQGLI